MRRPVLALAALVLLATPAAAEHEVQFRYTVIGYVKDARGQPLPGQTVELVRDRTGFSYVADTDAAGLYVVTARLADESSGETLTLRFGPARTRLVARFDPTNHADERGTRVDVEAGRFVERAAWFRSTLANLLGEGGRSR
ncbi:MAG: carboxypeptidase-like regulatory domain-containing protein [Candidatus Rokuibacteriota bacterium]